MILKAGTYRFNNTITPNGLKYLDMGEMLGSLEDMLNFIPFVSNDIMEGKEVNMIPLYYRFALDDEAVGEEAFQVMAIDFTEDENPEDNTISLYMSVNGEVEDSLSNLIVTIPRDATVYESIGNWFIGATDYNEVNATPLAEITYNGQVIASLNGGETATLSCEGKKMASDVVVKVDRVVIPNGDVTFNENGSYDVKDKATAIVDVKMPTPYRVNTFSDLPTDAVDGSLAIVLRG